MRCQLIQFSRGMVLGSLLMLSGATVALGQSSPFAGFAGNWSGSGTVSLSDGSNERIRCRATYSVTAAGTGLEQELKCASDSYRIELSSKVASQGGSAVTGTWSESGRNLHGNLQGKAAAGELSVFVEAAGFAASLTATTRGNRQSISIQSKGELRSVSINLTKS